MIYKKLNRVIVQIAHMHVVSQCILNQLPRIAGRVPRIGNEVCAVIDHVFVGAHNRSPPGHCLHAGRIDQTVILIRLPHLALSWVVWQQQRQTHIWMYPFYRSDGAGGHRVKSAIMSDHIVCHAIRLDVSHDGIIQRRIYIIRRIPMSYKKACLHVVITISLRAYVAIILLDIVISMGGYCQSYRYIH